MPFGDVFAGRGAVRLRTADGETATVGGSMLQNLALRVLGVPHLGLRVRARAALPFLIACKGTDVLDAGCGSGVYSLTLARLGHRVTAIDSDPSRVASLEELTREGMGRVVAKVADLASLPLADASFDKVLCTEVLEHIDDDRAALAELARVLRPGGAMVVTVPSEQSLAHAYEEDFGHARAGYSRSQLVSLLESMGLSGVVCRSYLHSRFGQWAWQINHRLFGSRLLTAITFYPLYGLSLLLDRLLPDRGRGLGYVAIAGRTADGS